MGTLCAFRSVPNTPTNLVVTQPDLKVPGSVSVTWASGGGSVTGYNLHYSTDNATFTKLNTGNVTSYTLGVTPVQQYYLKLTAYNSSGGESAPTAIVNFSTVYLDTYESYTIGALPNNWKQYDTGVGGSNTASIASDSALDSSGAQALHGGSTRKQLIIACDNTQTPIGFAKDQEVSMLVKPNDNIPHGAGVVMGFSGSGLSGTFYTALGGYNGGVALCAVNAGTIGSPIAQVIGPFIGSGSTYDLYGFLNIDTSPPTIKVAIQIKNDTLHPSNNNTWLKSDGTLVVSSKKVYAINTTDSSITVGNQVGIFSDTFALVAGDDFRVTSSAADVIPPVCTLTYPTPGATLTGTVTFTATAVDNLAVGQVDFYVDGSANVGTVIAPGSPPGTYSLPFISGQLTNGDHTVQAKATDTSGNVGSSAVVHVTETGSTYPTLPTIPQPLPHVLIEQAAYSGFPTNGRPGTIDGPSLEILPSVSYADCNSTVVAYIVANNPDVLVTMYHNISQVGLGMNETGVNSTQVDWAMYAETNSLDPESIYYHVSQPASMGGLSVSNTQYPAQFHMQWNSHDGLNEIVTNGDNAPVFPKNDGEALYAGSTYPHNYWGLGVTTPPSGGWSATHQVWNGTTWANITHFSDTTQVGGTSLSQTGILTADPPSTWPLVAPSGQPAGPFGNLTTAKYKYTRWLVSNPGNAGSPPVCTYLRARDFTGSGYTANGTIPAFDYANADAGDHWSLAGYAGRTTDFDAFFSYESREQSSYGYGRYLTNESHINTLTWAPDYFYRVMQTNSQFNGISMDNMSKGVANTGDNLVEKGGSPMDLDSYIRNLAVLGQTIWNKLNTLRSNSFIMCNVSKDLAGAAVFAAICPSANFEQLFSPWAGTWSIFEDQCIGIAAITGLPQEPITLTDSTIEPATASLIANGNLSVDNSINTLVRSVGWDFTNSDIGKYLSIGSTYYQITSIVSPNAGAGTSAANLASSPAAAGTTGLTAYIASFVTQTDAMSDVNSSYNEYICYLMVKKTRTFNAWWNGDSPATTWTDHYSPSAAVDVGADVDPPLGSGGTITPFVDTFTDPDNVNRTCRVYKREFANCVALLRPPSFLNSSTIGEYGGGSKSVDVSSLVAGHSTLYPLAAGAVHTSAGVSSVNLTNGQGLLLFKSPV